MEVLQTALSTPNPRSSITHLRVYGCRAYPLNPRIPRTQKLVPRAHIGYLVGYDSTNIFRIWVPSEKCIVSTRNVTFNKTLFYNPNEPDLVSQPKIRAEEIIDLVEIPHQSWLLEQDFSSESESDFEDETSDTTGLQPDTTEDVESRTLSNRDTLST